MNAPALYDDNAEQMLLGAILLSPAECWPLVSSTVKDSDFYDVRHQWIYKAISELGEQASMPAVWTLLDRMVVDDRRGKKATDEVTDNYLLSLTYSVPTSLGVSFYAADVRDWSKRRQLVAACQRIVQQAYNTQAGVNAVTETAYAELEAVLTNTGTKRETLADVVESYLDLRELEIAGRADALGIKTGLADIDRLLGGLMPGELFTIAGPTGGGKTTLMLQFLLNACKAGKRGAAFVMEMESRQIVRKLVASMAKVNTSRAVAKDMTAEDVAKEIDAANSLLKMPLELRYMPGATLSEITAECQRIKARGGLDMVVVDYLQIMSTENGRGVSRAQALGEITRGLKNMAGKLNTVVLLGSQMNREGVTGNPEPQLEHLKESGSIEQDSSRVGMLHLPDPNNRTSVRFFLRKNREGEIGTCPLYFERKFSRFMNAEKVQL